MRALILGVLALAGCGSAREPDTRSAWQVLRLGTPQRLLVFRSTGSGKVPAADTFRIDVYDGRGELRSTTESSAGWRQFAERVKSFVDPDLGGPCFEVEAPQTVGSDLTRQIYALIDDRPALIRLADRDGVYKQNQYEYPNGRVGPAFELQSPERLLQGLQSTDPRRILEVLVWMGGNHRGLLPPEQKMIYETLDETKSLRAAWALPALKARVEELTRNAHPWVAEAAKKALAAESP